MTDTALKIEPLEGIWKSDCPACGRLIESMMFEDGETLEYDGRPEVDPSQVSTHLMWGDCPHCEKRIYAIEVGIAANENPGHLLCLDHGHESKSKKPYIVTAGTKSWYVEHNEGVANATYFKEGESGGMNGNLPWLDIHMLPLFACEDGEFCMDKAETICSEIVPDLLKQKLWE